jgi:hypothetical protein
MELLDDRSVQSVVNVVPPDGMDLSDWATIDHEWIAAFDEIATPGIDSIMELTITNSGGDLGLGS